MGCRNVHSTFARFRPFPAIGSCRAPAKIGAFMLREDALAAEAE